jgi:hypothetical protein
MFISTLDSPLNSGMIIDLSHNTELRTISLGKIGYSAPHGPNSGGNIPLILSQVTSTHLEEVTLVVSVKFYNQVHGDVWRDIATALELPTYSHLRRIRVLADTTGGHRSWEHLEITVRNYLSSCEDRGLLWFCECCAWTADFFM